MRSPAQAAFGGGGLPAAAETVAGWREQDVPALGGTVVSVDEYEVIA